jgi:hypothetical protein
MGGSSLIGGWPITPPCPFLIGGNMKKYTDEELEKHPFIEKGLFDPIVRRRKTLFVINAYYGAEILDQLTAETYEARDYRRLSVKKGMIFS